MNGEVWQLSFVKARRGSVVRGLAGSHKKGSVEMIGKGYAWKPATCIKTDANIAGEVMEELEATVGLTAENLVDASRDEDAPLHNEFEWNDAIAAEGYRKTQAQHLIRSIVIFTEQNEQETNPVKIRAFFQTTSENYDHVTRIVCESDKKAALLAKAITELKWFENKYSMLSELDMVLDAINEFLGEQ